MAIIDPATTKEAIEAHLTAKLPGDVAGTVLTSGVPVADATTLAVDGFTAATGSVRNQTRFTVAGDDTVYHLTATGTIAANACTFTIHPPVSADLVAAGDGAALTFAGCFDAYCHDNHDPLTVIALAGVLVQGGLICQLRQVTGQSGSATGQSGRRSRTDAFEVVVAGSLQTPNRTDTPLADRTARQKVIDMMADDIWDNMQPSVWRSTGYDAGSDQYPTPGGLFPIDDTAFNVGAQVVEVDIKMLST